MMKEWKWVSLGVNCMIKVAIRTLKLQPGERLPFDFSVTSPIKDQINVINTAFATFTPDKLFYAGIHDGNGWPTIAIKDYPEFKYWHDVAPTRPLRPTEPRYTITEEDKKKFIETNQRRFQRLLKILSDEKENTVAIRADISSFADAKELYTTVRNKTKGNLYVLFIIENNFTGEIPKEHVVVSAQQIHPAKNTFGIQRLPLPIHIHTITFGTWLVDYLKNIKN